MKQSCEMIKDLLPLYHDGICSELSKQIVDEHLAECELCKSELEKIDNEILDGKLSRERGHVVERHTKQMRKASATAGIAVAGVMGVPILVCLIVNLATGHALDWFFIVLTALMTLASITVVPMLVPERKGLWTIGSFTATLTLLLLTCCLYSGGDWFFVVIIPVLFGLTVVFLPFALYQLPLKKPFSQHKGLICMAVDTLFLFATVIISGVYHGGWSADGWREALLSTTVCITLPWALLAIIRYMKSNGYIKAGLSAIAGGLYFSLSPTVLDAIASDKFGPNPFMGANLLIWNYDTVNPNVFLLTLLTGCIVGAALLVAGFVKSKANR